MHHNSIRFFTLLVICMAMFVPKSHAQGQTWQDWQAEASWPMAAANPQRTSNNTDGIAGAMQIAWYKPFASYISQRTQVIAAYDRLYIATAHGLVVLDAATGDELWQFQTADAIGHSPTIWQGVVYFGGLDQSLYAVDALSGALLWRYQVGSAILTSPLVQNVADQPLILVGARDGRMLAVWGGTQQPATLAWEYQTGAPIMYSPAVAGERVFFASNDQHAYALELQTGALIWQSAALPGAGFYSWWPVVFGEMVIFSGSNSYRLDPNNPETLLTYRERAEIYPAEAQRGDLLSPLQADADGYPSVNGQAVVDYYLAKPWRQTTFVFEQASGALQSPPPITWAGTQSGTRYPPIVCGDRLYQQTSYLYDIIPGGHFAGWQPNAPDLRLVSSDWAAVDEPHAASCSGTVLYWNSCCDREAGGLNWTEPDTALQAAVVAGQRPPTSYPNSPREWLYYSHNLAQIAPNYQQFFFSDDTRAVFGNEAGVYGNHGDTNPPVPYHNKLYFIRSNTLFAFAPLDALPSTAPALLPAVIAPDRPAAESIALGPVVLQARLQQMVQAILDAPLLRPGYQPHGLFDMAGRYQCGDYLTDYFHNPADTIFTLSLARPYLTTAQQMQLDQYVRRLLTEQPPREINHIGWQGAAREFYVLPPDMQTLLTGLDMTSKNWMYEQEGSWALNPFMMYALWHYGSQTNQLVELYPLVAGQLPALPKTDFLQRNPAVLHAYLAGYWGYLQMQQAAKVLPDDATQKAFDQLLKLRQTTPPRLQAQPSPDNIYTYCNTMNVAQNFMYLVPEWVAELPEPQLPIWQQTLTAAVDLAPFWSVGFAPEGVLENVHQPLYNGIALFNAYALLFRTPAADLERFLDAPVFAIGDLFYLQKLATILQRYSFQVLAGQLAQTVIAGQTVTFALEVADYARLTPITVTVETPDALRLLQAPPYLTESGVLTITFETSADQPSESYQIPLHLQTDDKTETLLLDLQVQAIADLPPATQTALAKEAATLTPIQAETLPEQQPKTVDALADWAFWVAITVVLGGCVLLAIAMLSKRRHKH
jgi:hypothetical protein